MNVKFKIFQYTITLLFVFFSSYTSILNAKSLSLKELLKMGMKHNPEIKTFDQRRQSTRDLADAADSLPDPMLSYEWTNLPVDSYSFSETPMSGKKIGLAQSFPFPGKLSGKKKIMQLKNKKWEHRFQNKKLFIAFMIKKKYYELVYSIHSRRILEEQKKLIKQLISSARSQYALGKIPQTEVINFQMEETDLIAKLLASHRDIKIARSELTKFVGADLSSYNLKNAVLPKSKINFKALDIKLVIHRALESNHLIKTEELNTQASVESVRLSKLSYYPDFNIKATYTIREPNPVDQGVDFASLIVSVNLPIWFNSKLSKNLKAANAQHFASAYQLQTAQAALTNEIQSIFLNLEESHKTFNLFETSLLPLVKQAVRTGKSAYLGGKVDYSTLLGSIRKRFDTELNSYRAHVRHETLIARIEFLLAGPIAP